MLKQIKEKHLLPATSWRGEIDHIDTSQINQELSYYIQSKLQTYGDRRFYQYITMNDGAVYELSSKKSSTKGIIARHCKGRNALQREIKNLTSEAIRY